MIVDSNALLEVGNSDSIENFSLGPTPITGKLGSCLIGQAAKLPQFSIPTYEEMLSIYFDQSKSNQKTTITTSLNGVLSSSNKINVNHPDGSLYHIVGNLNILKKNNNVSDITNDIVGDKVGVIFVDGDLLFAPQGNKLEYNHDQGGLVFIVKGTIFINKDVTQVDAFLIAHGGFCSTSTGVLTSNPSTISCNPPSTSSLQLVINGSVIFLKTGTEARPKFHRETRSQQNVPPAEVINYQPKFLVILKDIFSRDQSIWSEI